MFGSDVPTVSVDQIPAGSILLDVREDEEWAAGHIDGAVHVPMHQVPNRLAFAPDGFASDQPLVIVCKMGGRSGQVAAWLNQQGIASSNLDGGMLAWATSGRPMITDDGSPARVA
jgi:rhodanese-related sulfurtransferase